MKIFRFLLILLPFLLSACASLNVAPFDAVGASKKLEDDEARLWKRSLEEQEKISDGGFLYNDSKLREYVNSILKKIAPENLKDTGLLFEAEIIKDPRLNAFCYPNGVIFVHTGMLSRMDNEAQLATVLGHEMGHAVKRHMLKQFRDIKNKTAFMNTFSVTSAVLGVGLGEIVGVLGQIGTVAAIYGYSREHEREADRYGFDMIVREGYDVNEAPMVFERLREDFDKEQGPDPFFFSSHPKLTERIKSYRELIATVYVREAKDAARIKNQQIFIEVTRKILLDDIEMDISIGRPETAKANAEKYIKHYPNDPWGYFYMGKVYEDKFEQPENKKLKEKIEKFIFREKAQEYYKKAIEKDANFAISYRNIGMLYFKEGKKQEAKKYLSDYLKLAPQGAERKYAQGYLDKCDDEKN